MRNCKDLYLPERSLCTAAQIAEEEDYLIRYGADELPHEEHVRRWQRMLTAKEWLESTIQLVRPIETPTTPPPTTTTGSGCQVCLSEVCNCESYKR